MSERKNWELFLSWVGVRQLSVLREPDWITSLLTQSTTVIPTKLSLIIFGLLRMAIYYRMSE